MSDSCDPVDCSLPGSSVHVILQARILEWVAISFSNAWKWKMESESEVVQSCPTLGDPMDCSLPGSSAHGIFQARGLERGACLLHMVTTLFLLCFSSVRALAYTAGRTWISWNPQALFLTLSLSLPSSLSFSAIRSLCTFPLRVSECSSMVVKQPR